MNDKKRFSIRDVFYLKSIKVLIIFFIIQVLIFLLIFGLSNWHLIGAINGTFVSGAIGFGIAGLSFTNNQGIFDVFQVGFENLISVSKKNGRKKYDLYGFKESKVNKRNSNKYMWIIYLIDGIIFLIASIILFCFY